MAEAKMEIEIGGTLEGFLSDVGDRWEAAARGEAVAPTERIVFRNWIALSSVLSDRRMELLRELHARPMDGVRALARALDRDVKHVHGDVKALEGVGLIVRDEKGGLSMPFDEIRSVLSFVPPHAKAG